MHGEQFKYRELIKFTDVNKNWGPILNPRSEFLHPAAHAFFENVCRMNSLVVLPAEMAARVTREQIAKDHAIFKATGKLDLQIPQILTEDVRAAVDQELSRLPPHPSFWEQGASHLRATVGIEYINKLLSRDTGMIQSMEALLALAVIDAWSAFEVLAPDLWIAAVNEGPEDFAKRVGVATEQAKTDSSFAKNWGDKLQFDPRKDYARSLLETGRVSFKRLDRIIKWYSITFKNNVEALFKDTADGYIHALAAYRNVLVHNGGRVDKDFIKQIEPVDDFRARFEEGKQLELDGELVRNLRNAGTELGKALIRFVDNVITPLPEAISDPDVVV